MASAPDGRTSVGPVLLGWAAALADAPDPLPGDVDARRIAGFGSRRRREFRTGRALLAHLLTDRFGTPGTVDTGPCPHCGADHGPVVVRGVPAVASVAHTEGLTVAAVAPRALASRLGVDVERVSADPVRSADLGRLLGVPPDAALQRWTGVEAVLKADGRGLRTDPGQIRFSPGSARLEGTPHAYRVERVPDASGFEISVAWLPSAP